MLDYDGQAQELELAFQKLKNSESSTSDGPQSSIMKSLKIPPKYLKNNFFEMWGEENVLEWEDRKLNMIMMARLALELNLDHKEAHYGISLSWKGRFYTINSRRFPKGKAQFTAAVQKILGKEESTRRLVAFFSLLAFSQHCCKVETFKALWYGSKDLTPRQAAQFERRFGLSVDPQSLTEIPRPNTLENATIVENGGSHLVLKQQVNISAGRFELLKIGDLLQFGSNYLLDDTKNPFYLGWSPPNVPGFTGHVVHCIRIDYGKSAFGYSAENAFRNPRRADRFNSCFEFVRLRKEGVFSLAQGFLAHST
ncbi:hypothetical protein H4Q26_010168 [Puccinia striiformis f. sp. tritici PST-130]|nr:hypothetical protein H4Q26_010168 [Puccinia striiformis f. sp. tritici PST-130]